MGHWYQQLCPPGLHHHGGSFGNDTFHDAGDQGDRPRTFFWIGEWVGCNPEEPTIFHAVSIVYCIFCIYVYVPEQVYRYLYTYVHVSMYIYIYIHVLCMYMCVCLLCFRFLLNLTQQHCPTNSNCIIEGTIHTCVILCLCTETVADILSACISIVFMCFVVFD